MYDMCGLDLRGKKYTQWMNDATFMDYYTRLKKLALNRFEWINLPPTCDQRYLELILFDLGKALFLQSRRNDGFFITMFTNASQLNMYRIPIMRQAVTITNFNELCDDQNSVIIWNNYLRQPTELTCRLAAERMTKIRRAMDININGQKTPYIFSGSQAQVPGFKKMMSELDNNAMAFFVNKDSDPNNFKQFMTPTPPIYLDLYKQLMNEYSEYLTAIGINNLQFEKGERLITNEVDSNNETILINRDSDLNARKQACEMINDLFNLNIDVRFRGESERREESTNGNVYDRTENRDSKPSESE